MWLIITILVGILGGYIAIKLKIPAGAIVGSMIAIAVFNVTTGKAVFPDEFKTITQIGTGAYIGSRLAKKDVIELRKIIIPALILTTVLCLFNIVVSLLLSSTNESIDLTTALFATAPAGVADMTLISVDFGADSSKVAALQLIRLASILSIMPTLFKIFISKNHKGVTNQSNEEVNNKDNEKVDRKELYKRMTYTMIVGFIFGYIGYFSRIPAGVISFSMIACAFFNIKTSKAYMSVNLRKVIQMLAGCVVGSKITMEQVISLQEIVPSIVMITLGFIIINFVLAFLITRFSTLDIVTSLYASAPGGITDMAIIASEMGADAPKVAALQFTRVFSVIAFYPIIIKAITGLLN